MDNPLHVILEQKEKENRSSSFINPHILDLLKWVIGTLVIGIAGIIINNKNQQTELRLKQMEVDSKLIEAVSTKFDTTFRVQIIYLEYIKPFISTDSLKTAVEGNIIRITQLFEKSQKDSLTKDEVPIVLEAGKTISPAEKEALNQLTIVGSNTQNLKDISELKKSEQAIIGNKVSTTFDSLIGKKLMEIKEVTTPKELGAYKLIDSPATKWCKEGYYTEYYDVIRIGVMDIKNNVVEVKITNLETNRVTNEKLFTGKEIELNYQQFKYKIELDYVGAGGKNPFTKAAYITVSRYAKT